MKKIYVLSKENVDLAKEEVLALTGPQKYELYKHFLIVNTKERLEQRLAYTKAIYKFLFLCEEKELIKNIKKFNWKKVYKKNFCLRVHNKKYSEKDLASYIWRKLKNPKVNLENPKTKIELFFVNRKFLAGLLMKEIKEPFDKRKAHLRPELHPTSLHPKLARCSINLTGIKKGNLLDPFCGSGGILIEAGLIGLMPTGYDIDEKMLARAKKNLKHYKTKKFKLEKKDALSLKNKIDYIVTDLPYGKSSGKLDLVGFYLSFLKTLKMVLKKKAVLVFPNFVNYKALIKKSGLKLRKEFSIYIHKSLTRKITILTP